MPLLNAPSAFSLNYDLEEGVLEGLLVLEVDADLGLRLLEPVEGELVVLSGLSRYVEGVSAVDEDRRVFLLELPSDLEALEEFEPVFDGQDGDLRGFGLAGDVERLLRGWRQGLSYEVVEQCGTVGQREEERALVHVVLDLGDVRVHGHGERLVQDLVLSLTIGGDVQDFLAVEVALETLLVVGLDRHAHLARLRCRNLHGDLLGERRAHYCRELDVLHLLFRLRHALSVQVHVQRVGCAAVDFQLHFVEADVVIQHVRVERYREVQVFVWRQMSFRWRDCEVFSAERCVPLELARDVA